MVLFVCLSAACFFPNAVRVRFFLMQFCTFIFAVYYVSAPGLQCLLHQFLTAR